MADFHGTYDPSKVILSIGSASITGFSKGDFFTAKYDEDRYFKIPGVDGEVCRAKNNSRAGRITLVISSASECNEQLMDIFVTDGLASSVTPVAIGIADLSGKSKASASKCWLKNYPDLRFAEEIVDNEWTFDCADLTVAFAGSNKPYSIDTIINLF